MPKFLVIHPIPRNVMEGMSEIPPEENKQIIELRSYCSVDAYWIKSWYVPELEKLFCEWNAKDAESIRKVWDENIKGIGIDSIAEMIIVDAEEYREK